MRAVDMSSIEIF